MKLSLVKLHKFFKLETERGYDDRAVMGGLVRILGGWEIEARADGVPEDLVLEVGNLLRAYHDLDEASRADGLAKLWERLQQTSQTPLPPLPAPPPKEARTEGSPIPSSTGNLAGVPDHLEPPESDHLPRLSRSASRPSPSRGKAIPNAINAPTTVLPDVGPRHAQTLSRLGLQTLRDMLYYFPRRYVDYTQLKPINRLWFGEEVTVIGTVQSIANRPTRGGQTHIAEAVISDGTGALRVTWFNPWMTKRLSNGAQISISGKIDQYLGRLVMVNPEWEPLEQQQLSTNRIVPVYSLTASITQRWLRKLMNQVVTYWAPRLPDFIPESVRRSAELVDLASALVQIHFPDSWDKLKAARHRLAFDEIFLLQSGVLRQKRLWQDRTARVFDTSDDWLAIEVNRLPFPLTAAQVRTLADVRTDLASGRPMNRLLQGDVGSGKTVIAALAIAMVTRHGAQAALMAPTSILAEQHYQTVLKYLAGIDAQAAPDQAGYALATSAIRLMIGATPEAEKRQIRDGLADGSIKLVVGTHALIEDPVTFSDLQLAIVDEQHRFGVEQRAILRSKGSNPHLLVMTATPIPRSLALTVYGDLDLSVMDEMPAGRQPVETYVIAPVDRERAYRLICNQVEAGRQAFIIYPLVEESEQSDSKAAVEEHAHLQTEIFPQFKLGLLHGRLRPEEKEEVMAGFKSRAFDILVSTSVVEVGVDVPNATVMLIEGADRFGLAQLHQFRGRVGRGGDQAFCLLIPESEDATENERLQVMAQTNDGFVLAEKDLEQRGPGQFLGTRQSGFTELQLANLTDVHLIEKARRQALILFEQDPDLQQPEHQLLATALEQFWGGGKGDIS
jgi:ATP-dependent DNA helicase RecG